MKLNYKRFISGVAAISFICSSSAFAVAIKNNPKYMDGAGGLHYSMYEDFTGVSVGELPDGFLITNLSSTSKAEVVSEQTEEGKIKNMFLLSDGSTGWDDIKLFMPITYSSKNALIKIKFKFEKTLSDFLGFRFEGYSGQDFAFRMISYSGGSGVGFDNDSDSIPGFAPSNFVSGQWYTLELFVDGEKKSVDALLQSEAMKNVSYSGGGQYDTEKGTVIINGISFNSNAKGNTIDKLFFWTTSNAGDIYIDYILVDSNAEGLSIKSTPKQKIPLPVIPNPVYSVPSYENISVNCKGEYMYFVNKPFIADAVIYVPLREIAVKYGYSTVFAGGSYTLIRNDESITVNASNGLISGAVSDKLSSGLLYSNKTHFVPIVEFARIMGDVATVSGNSVVIE